MLLYSSGVYARSKPSPIWLSRRSEAFDSDDFLFELKIDGFRSLAYISRMPSASSCLATETLFRGFKELAAWIGGHLRVESAVLDGEIACVDQYGQSVSYRSAFWP